MIADHNLSMPFGLLKANRTYISIRDIDCECWKMWKRIFFVQPQVAHMGEELNQRVSVAWSNNYLIITSMLLHVHLVHHKVYPALIWVPLSCWHPLNTHLGGERKCAVTGVDPGFYEGRAISLQDSLWRGQETSSSFPSPHAGNRTKHATLGNVDWKWSISDMFNFSS